MQTKPNTHQQNETTTAAKAAVVQTTEVQTKAGARTAPGEEQRALIQRVIMGVDMHKRFCTVTMILSGSGPQPAQTIATARMVGWVRQQQKRHPRALFTIGYEAGPCGYWMARALNALEGIGACHVMAPEPLNGKRKTDKRDSRSLALKLRSRAEDGDPRAFSAVRIPTIDEEQKRSILRHRRALLRIYGAQVMRCRSAALLHGCELAPKFWKGDAWEQTLPAALPAQTRKNIASHRAIILAAVGQIADYNEQIEQLAAQEPPAPHGIGALTWLSLKLEVGDWNRFNGRRAVASYTGLCPGEHTTGNHRVELSIDKMGNRTMRHLLIEAAWRLARHQPDYPPIKKHLGKAKGSRSRRRAIVAVARQLAIDLWRLATGRAGAEKLGLRHKPNP
jgi:transposase